MKIAFVANTTWNIYNFRKGLVHHFLSNGDEVLVLTPKDSYTDSVADWGVKWINTPLNGTGINPIQDLKYLLQLAKIFKKERPDVVLGYTIKANIYSCLATFRVNIPIICNVSGLGTVFLVKGIAGKIAMALYKMAFRKASFVFFQNEDDRDLFVSKVQIPHERMGILPGSGIDLTAFQYSEPNYGGKTDFIMISRLIVEKGVREFAEAASYFAEDASIAFTLVGRLDENHSRSISKTELDSWTANGWISYYEHTDQVKELIKRHEVVVLPSYREGTPRTLLEGAAIGRALLATDVPGCKEVVLDGVNGFLFELKNAKSLVSKIKLYLSLSADERLKLSKASRDLVERKYDENLVIRSYNEVIHRMTSST